MNSRTKHYNRILALLIGLLLLIFVTFLHQSPQLQAQEATPIPDKKYQADNNSLTAAMAAFLQNHQPAENLPAQAATPCVGGFAGIYPCNKVNLLAFMPLSAIGGGEGSDIWGWTDPSNGKEYALMSRTNGTAFINISDPENPVYLGNLPSHTGATTWRDVKVYANHAFIVSDNNGNHGMQIFDLTGLRTVTSPPVTFSETAHYAGFGSAHNIVINEKSGFAYAVGADCSGGLHAVDISNPTSPTFAGCFSSDGYTHDAQCVIYNGPDLEHIGKEVCFNANEDTVTIVDMTDKANPDQLSRSTYSNSRYTHQAWLTEDQSILLVNDELDEQNLGNNTRTFIWNVSNLDSPTLLNVYEGPTPAIDHNLYTRGNLVFESNYRAGLRILDASSAASGSLNEVGFFDVFPSSDSNAFNGAWSNYPYFDSDVVIVSGIEQGLFILDPDMLADFRMEPTAVALNICGPGSDSTTFNLDALYGYNSAVTMSVSGVPTGATSSFSNNPLTPPNNTLLTVTNSSAAANDYLLTVTATEGTITYDEYLKLTIAEAAVAPALTTPANNATNVSTTPTLMWTAVAGATGYDIEIATDPGFSNIVESATGISGTSYNATLAGSTQYYWRVRSNNFCSTSSYSAADNFTTGAAPSTICRTPNLSIPDNNSTGVQDSMSVGNSNNIDDLNITLNVTHTYVGDLKFKLIHDDTGTTVTFIDRPGYPASNFGCSSNNIDATIDDEGGDGSVETTCNSLPALGGSLTPAPDSLSAFDGEIMSGTWTLTASDHFNGDTGTVVEWCIVVDEALCAAPTAVADVTATKNGNNVDVDLNWSDTGADFYDVWHSINDPYFTPGPDCSASADCTTVTTNGHSTTGLGNVADNYSYQVVARSSCGATAVASNRTGEFDFAIVVGTP